MDENFILELAAHMRDFGYWRNTVLFFRGKSYSDFDRSFFNAKCQERNRTLIGKKPYLPCPVRPISFSARRGRKTLSIRQRDKVTMGGRG